MKRLTVLVLCLLLAAAFVACLPGCGNKEETQDQENGVEKVEVPNVTGLSTEEAIEKVQESDLDYSIKQIQGEGAPGEVVSQDPPGGTMLTPDMTVYLTVGK